MTLAASSTTMHPLFELSRLAYAATKKRIMKKDFNKRIPLHAYCKCKIHEKKLVNEQLDCMVSTSQQRINEQKKILLKIQFSIT